MNCIIIEDEMPAQRILKSYIKKIPDLNLKGSFQTASSANLFLKNNDVEVVLLDINLPDIPGIDFIKTVKNPPQVIFTTAYPHYAVSSFELETVVDYLVKPFSFDRFLKAISKAEKLINRQALSEEESIFINVDKTIHKLILNDILYIESARNYISFVTAEKKLTIIDSLKNWKEILSPTQFIQIHKSFIVNSRKVDKFNSSYVYIQNEKISIGRTYKESFQAQMRPSN
ncbi:DNA-binding response regulator, LytR/AlgR family [Tenacibaculum sp. MAR_2009_124]|uniref:LytR/AlgR family response regulator transcription factor n=1 Tax=Tenacibaculum sp. MAR_2009_124 TaxID=1250059 RepID=UPI00089C8C9B|nr:LytTR family DNA-binding domain-containing protein [Tenacibaculum sp. MAR_2009_124]SEC38574.1 DNA-binding response regulator, LytR/AlgR family [Tenacibaculum sp. MAR_2009_124]